MYSILAIAIAPGLAIMMFIYFMDKHEKEPIRLLLLSFFFGLLSTGLTLFITRLFTPYFPTHATLEINEFFKAFLQVGMVEELSKYLFLMLFLYPRKEFNEPFDGIVYAVMIGMGFATLENILYSINGGMSVALVRMFTAVPAHATFAAIMGYFAGSAKFKEKNALYSLIGLFGAVLFHGAYDYFLFISHIPGMFLGALVSLVAGIYFSIKAMRLHSDASPFRKKLKRFVRSKQEIND